MKKKNGREKILLRYGFIIMLMLVLAGCIVWALIDNTIISADAWNAKAEEGLSRIDTIPPERGDILASDGSILATNMNLYIVRVDYNVKKFNEDRYRLALDSLADSLARYFPTRDRKGWKDFLASQIKKPRGKRWSCAPLVARASYSDYLRIRRFPFFNIGKLNQTGLYKDDILIRTNPYGRMALRSIGRVGQTKEEGVRRGRSGLELALDGFLRGKEGYTKTEMKMRGTENAVDISPQRGYDVVTTIDIKIQDIVEHELNKMLEHIQSDWGLCVLMDVKTGDIKAISNLDRTSSGKYIEGMNRAVQHIEPGSVVKVLSMMVALDSNLVNLTEKIPTPSPWYYHNKKLLDTHCSAEKNAFDIIIESSNIGMAKIITRAWEKTPGKFYSAVKNMGFLDSLKTGIAGERNVRIDSISKANSAGQLALSRMAFGYSTMIPPMNTLALYNAIANEGRYVRPRLVKGLRGGAGADTTYAVSYIRDSICSRRTASILREMMRGVVHDPKGTAYRAIHNGNVAIAGKTGTCNVQDTATLQYVHGRSRLAFCGFFPADEPRYTCIAVVSPPRQNAFGAPTTSAVVVRNIAESLFARGLLGNRSDFRADAAKAEADGAKPTPPVFYASTDTTKPHRLHKRLKVASELHKVKQPKAPQSGIPSVIGYNIREAIAVLERAGYNVGFTGSGCVVAQTPVAGTLAPDGHKVTLTLSR